MSENAVQITNLMVYYPGFKLNIPSFSIPKGYVMGLVGKNGAGKSTLIRSLLEIISRNQGDIEILSMNFKDHATQIKNRIGYVNDTFVFPPNATAEQMGKQIGQFYERFDDELYHQLLRQYQLPIHQKFKDFSKGMCAKFSIIFAMAHHADLLILDEPTANLDPVSRKEVLDLLYELMQDEEKTILFSTHITSDLERIADYITLIDQGKIQFVMSKDELQLQHQIVRIEGPVPADLKQTLKGIKKTEEITTGLCTQAQRFKNTDRIQFKKTTIEELMVYWDIQDE